VVQWWPSRIPHGLRHGRLATSYRSPGWVEYPPGTVRAQLGANIGQRRSPGRGIPMRPDERLILARLAYQRAVGIARAESSTLTWRALLTASNNLKRTVKEQTGKSPREQRPPLCPVGTRNAAAEPAAAPRLLRLRESEHRKPVEIHDRKRVPRRAVNPSILEMIGLWEISQALIQKSIRLCVEARALGDSTRAMMNSHRARPEAPRSRPS